MTNNFVPTPFHQYILDEDGNPVPCNDPMRWARWMGAGENCRVALDKVDGVTVSTVFLGIDYAWGLGAPLFYETMIFGLPAGDEYQRRCTTRGQALIQHREAVGYARGVLVTVSGTSVEEPPPPPEFKVLVRGTRRLNLGDKRKRGLDK